MKTSDRLALVDILEKRRTSLALEFVQDLVPRSLRGIPQTPGNFDKADRPDFDARTIRQQRPPERGHDEYSRFKMAKLEHVASFFPPRLCEAINESTIRAWEITKDPKVLATEGVRTEIAETGNYDGVMFLDVGYAQEIATELFPFANRAMVSSCCKYKINPGQY